MLTGQEVPKPCYCDPKIKKVHSVPARTAAPYFPQTVSDHMVQTSDKLFCLILLNAALSNSEVDSSDLAMYLVVRKKPIEASRICENVVKAMGISRANFQRTCLP